MKLRTIGWVSLFLLSCSIVPRLALAEEISDRYDGLFLAESRSAEQYYWYVDPRTHERYAINSANDFSRLLQRFGEGISKKELILIPESTDVTSSTKIDSALYGRIFLDVSSAGEAWYVDPLSGKRFFLANGNAGFVVAQGIAVDIRDERLSQIPVTHELGFDLIKYRSSQLQSDESFDFDTYDDVFTILREDHLFKDTFTDADLFYGSLKGMIKGTDDINTEFWTPEENRAQQDNFFGDLSIEGIGAVIQARNDSIYIVSLIHGAPAERAGLQALDQIIAINNEETKGLTVGEAVTKIKGPAGTTVKLTVYREAAGLTFDVIVPREHVEVLSVEGDSLNNGSIAYMQFRLFTGSLVDDFLTEMKTVITPQTKGIIVDLRDNIGGITQSAARLADLWLDNNERVYSTRRFDQQYDFYANPDKLVPDLPTVILVNGGTASASEIFTLALQQAKKATVVGTQTYGKGTGQDLVNFSDGSGLKYTTFEWLAPDGSSIDGIGVTPDILVPAEGSRDVQLDRAELILNGR